MKILAISGGTKNGTNDAMAREALMGAQEAGAEIEFINLFNLELKPCTGCRITASKAVRKPFFRSPLKNERINSADGILWVLPNFIKGVPGIFKMIQDRLCGPSHDIGTNTVAKMIAEKMGKPGPGPEKFPKKVVSFISIGGSDWMTRFETDVRLAAMVPMWKIIDIDVFTWSKSLILNDEGVARVHQIGVNLVNAAKDFDNAEYLGDQGVCPHCHSRNFYFHPDGKTVECEVCGIKGQLDTTDGFKFTFDPEQLEHAHDDVPGKLLHMKDIENNENTLMNDKKSTEYKARQEKYKNFIQSSKPEK